MVCPAGALLSSDNEARQVLPTSTLAGVRELEIRDRRMESILGGGFLSTDAPQTLGLTEDQLGRLRCGLKRSMHIADHIADLQASFLVAMSSHVQPSPTTTNNSRFYEELRSTQICFIRNLSTPDLAFLYKLVELAGSGFSRYRQHLHRSDPA